jgi:hypothetical protein
MQLREYLGFLLELLSMNPYIKNQNINLEERAPDAGIIKGIITFIDDSSLHLKEFVIMSYVGWALPTIIRLPLYSPLISVGICKGVAPQSGAYSPAST